jgi:alpha-ketoglutarate-dependent taurine dioxygenase
MLIKLEKIKISSTPINLEVIFDSLIGNGLGIGHFIIDLELDEMKANLKDTARFRKVASSDGAFSIVENLNEPDNYSANTFRFAAHTDGLARPIPPMFSMLYCISDGSSASETYFLDTFAIAQKMQQNYADAYEVIKRLEQVYIKNNGQTFARPFVEAHPISGMDILNITLGRAFTRPREDLKVMQIPHQEESVQALICLFNLMKEHQGLRHHWTKGDLIIWDNHRFIHGRDNVSDCIGRKLLRVWWDGAKATS